jgi:hypothetical protein
MKNLILTSVAFLFSITSSFAQVKNSGNTFVGHWVSDQTDVETIFFRDNNGKLQISEFNTNGGERLENLCFKEEPNVVTVKIIARDHNWVTVCKYMVDKNGSLICEVTGPIKETINYTRIK